MFVIVNSFPSCTTTVFSWFPGFSLVQVMFGCTRLEASQIKCKVSPSRTVVSPLIPVILNGTKSNQTITCKLQGQLLNGSISNTLKVIIHDFKIFFANLAHANEIHMCYDCINNTSPWIIIYYKCFNMCSLTNSGDLKETTKFF